MGTRFGTNTSFLSGQQMEHFAASQPQLALIEIVTAGWVTANNLIIALCYQYLWRTCSLIVTEAIAFLYTCITSTIG